MKTTLYDISDRYLGFMALVENAEIDDPEAITDTLDAINQEFDEKLDNIACLYKSLLGEAELLDAEAKKLSERARFKKNVCERLKNYLSSNMGAMGRDKFENGRTKITFSKSKSLEIEDEDALFSSLIATDKMNLVKLERKFDKTGIKKEILAGGYISGATIKENRNIQIK